MHGLILSLCTVAQAISGQCAPSPDLLCHRQVGAANISEFYEIARGRDTGQVTETRWECDSGQGCWCPVPTISVPEDEVFHDNGATWKENHKHAELHIYQLYHYIWENR